MTPVNIILAVAGTQGVLNAMDSVRGALGGIASAALGTTSALTGVKSGLELGGELNDLSARTGQAVRDLVVVRRALDNAGVGGANAAQYIGLLQKAISGLNEEGGKTDGVFKRLGLDPDQLKNMGVRDQLDALVGGFSRIQNPAERATLAMQLFGRSGAQMLQLLGDPTAMQVAQREAGRLADRLQGDNAKFDELGDRLSLAKTRLQEFWVVAAEKALPSLTRMAEVIESFNPAPLAAAAGNFAAIVAAVGGAKLITTLDNVVLNWATNPGVNVMGQAFAGRFLAPMTGALAKILPIGLAAVVAYEIVSGIKNALVQWHLERDAADNAAANAEAKETQRQRDALRHVQSLAELDAQRKKTAEEIAALETKAKTNRIGVRDLNPEELRRQATGEKVTEDLGGRQTVVYGLDGAEAQRLAELKRLQATQNSGRAEEILATNQKALADAKALDAARAVAVALKNQAGDHQKAADAAKLALAPAEEKLRILDAQAGKVLEQYYADVGAANLAEDDAAREAARTKFKAASLAIASERRGVEKAIAEEKKKLADAEAAAAEKSKQAAEAALRAEMEGLRLRQEAAKNALEDRQLEIQRALLALSSDFSRTDASKWGDRKKQLQDAVAAANAYLVTMREIAAAAPAEGKPQADANVRGAQQDVFSAESQLAGVGADPNSFAEQMIEANTAAANSIGTLQQQIALGWSQSSDTIRTSMGTALGDMVLTSGSAGDKIKAAGWSIAQSFVRNTAQMVADWIYQHTVLAAVSWAFEGQKTGATAAGAATRSVIQAGETGLAITNTAIQTGAHIAGENTKTGWTLAGAVKRGIIRLGETIWHGIQVLIRVGAHLVGETLQTGITIAQSALRIPAILAESLLYIAKAAAGALAAMASIPYVGPFLAVGAMLAIMNAGKGMIQAASHKERGGMVAGGEQLVWMNEKGPEFVWSAPAVRAIGEGRLNAMHEAARNGDLSSFSQAATPASSAMDSGGDSGGAGGGRVSIYNAYFNDELSARQYLAGKQGRRNLIRQQRGYASEFGMET